MMNQPGLQSELTVWNMADSSQISSDANKIWNRCLRVLESKVNKQSFHTWLRPTQCSHFDSESVVIDVPNSFFAGWLEEHFLGMIRSAISDVTSLSPKISFQVVGESQFDTQEASPPEEEKKVVEQPSVFNPRYTFETFVVGKSNQFAHAASWTVAQSPGRTAFNPLTMYGGVGLGKTHLLHAIAHRCLVEGKNSNIVYTTSEKFTFDFINSIQNNSNVQFGKIYRGADVLLVDDIQFFINKEATQEEFFHTFNALHQSGKQIVLTCDRPLNELRGLEERLISRFQWGLVVDIQPPDLETRIAILQKKSEMDQIFLPREVISYIAENVTSSIRELEGALIKLLAHSSLIGADITLELAQQVLKDTIKIAPQNMIITIEMVQRRVCQHYNIPIDLLIGKTREKEVVFVRQVAMYLAKILTNSSLKTIGLHFGGRDHSTVVHSIQLVESRLKQDRSLAEDAEVLTQALRSTQVR